MTKEECAEYLDSNPQDLKYVLDKVLSIHTASARPADKGVISTQRTYSLAGFICNKDAVQIGDRVKLPAFTVPAVTMDGEEELFFGVKSINADEAIVIDRDENGNFILIFDHCLFRCEMDLNGEWRFEKTQLGQYLRSEFLRAMNGAGIPAIGCGLISAEEMFGDNALEYFKKVRNRIACCFDEDYGMCYWLSTLYQQEAGAAYFCTANNCGERFCYGASHARGFVRPRFVISEI